MPVNTTHPDYDAMLPAWLRARDVLAGEDAVKAAGTKYLPRLDSQSDEEYAAYVARASFFGATARTLEEYLDLIFRRAPSINPQPATLNGFLSDCDLWGLEMVRYARRVVGEVLSVGRAGSLVLPTPLSSAEQLDDSQLSTLNSQLRPCVSLWKAEDILNWKVERVGGAVAVVEVVLRDPPSPGLAPAPEASAGEVGGRGADRIRVLRLERANGAENGLLGEGALPGRVCVQEIWKREEAASPGLAPTSAATAGEAEASGTAWVLAERVALKRDGGAVPFIPFVFHGPRHSRPEPDGLPLADMIASSLDHYRLDADYKQGLHLAALPTAWVSGFDKDASLKIGSSTAWVSEVPGASAGYLEFSGHGLGHLEKAIEKVERRMALLGARMLEAPSGELSTLNSQPSTTLSGLGSIVESLNESLSRVLRIAQWWIEGGDVRTRGASIAMDSGLHAPAVSGELIGAVVGAWREGAISRDTMLDWLKRREVLPEGRSVEEERALIHGKLRAGTRA